MAAKKLPNASPEEMRLTMRAERVAHGLSARDIANYLGTNTAKVYMLESGRVDPLSEDLAKLCELYDVEPEILLRHGPLPMGVPLVKSA